MKLLQLIIVSIMYMVLVIAIMIFIQGFIYRITKISIYNKLIKYIKRQASNQNNKRK